MYGYYASNNSEFLKHYMCLVLNHRVERNCTTLNKIQVACGAIGGTARKFRGSPKLI